ncbi:MAG: arsenate reductase ArsC [Deltaproteobacteria bacterium]
MENREKKRVLFICTHNSARSQMAEGLLRAIFGARYESQSAGTEARGVNPYAVRAMARIGVDISWHRSKTVAEFDGEQFDYVVTVCDHARENCPYYAGGRAHLHRDFDDPSRAEGEDEVKLAAFERARDEIEGWIRETFG